MYLLYLAVILLATKINTFVHSRFFIDSVIILTATSRVGIYDNNNITQFIREIVSEIIILLVTYFCDAKPVHYVPTYNITILANFSLDGRTTIAQSMRR